ncbi:bifunctional GTP diphosphokinase/guanosine-3',5'-bis pyrophosphate 3'-pyrophosphohydrolase [Ursidibacter maritimus]|uniref:guanosine-3',5'-bis(diphosphate) 3'-diphosphatase n=1 Tax=Ursidibacter maritimus TaxID=1331689 RepID=A0A949SZY1_9PAST|nr:bifunctional GTP diphosphokinase/guanosine-3',5'-bis pyrophosphate 3'-pyrophosphohydrolase [Ursidibacter maritimus]KAE9538756.1 guanosine-3',5'-bis(diphosphate) 3'-pyrophosphohydrolase [Ursidibacter maritimus]MBV6523376.1 bifunctional GTP diphosphokinase/guanosine-3',5'-bis pyrophosphate 3'-pyrophosphohydrolase [Ursidibacter maritimus]MBV6526451.1 bifunctional GTP diphosphokinase/guanosine-3',5'-bis pyrophosphate 3'-pyrophosphohydrolase [Ursidibacter maritimus]MBV6527782.1 bifunctional GTP d
MDLFEPLSSIIQGYLPAEQIERVKRAFVVARDAHEGQFRSSGEPYITHPVAVACIIAEMKLDHEAVMAALLHDVIEDTPYTEEQLAEEFGASVAEIVQGVSKLDKLKFRTRQEAQVENFRKMILAMTKDVRVVLIKLSDRTHNMRTLGALRPDKRLRIAKETLEIYTPLAHRLGMESLKNELEDLCFKAMYPYRYEVIKRSVETARGNLQEMILRISAEIKARLDEVGMKCRVYGKERPLYYLYQKIREKTQHFNSILDIYSFRVVVESVDNCYRVLGQMHSLYKPLPFQVKDYIAVPKTNGYQSLHTSMIGPRGVPVDVLIRTEEMDQMARLGVAAHWGYQDHVSTSVQVRTQQWLKSIVEMQQSAGNSAEFIENVKSDLFSSDIYVFTPKGRIVQLPANATAVDFAYALHTDIGDRCIGAVVDHNPYPLSQPLQSGQTIEIQTAETIRLNALWLNFVVTAKARSCIRSTLKRQQRDSAVSLGKRQLLLSLNSQNFEQIDPLVKQNLLDELKLASFDDLLAEIGLGNQISGVVAQRLSGQRLEIDTDGNPENNQPLAIQGVDSSLISFAKCCLPVPGDEIIAYISSGKGLSIHHIGCRNVQDYAQDQRHYMPVSWEIAKEKSVEFDAEIWIDILNQQGVLADITTAVAKMKSNILSIQSEARAGGVYQVKMLISVKDKTHLDAILHKLSYLVGVVKAVRSV